MFLPRSFDKVRAFSDTAPGRVLRDIPIRYFNASIEGASHIPQQEGALLVGNHAMLGVDSFVLSPLVNKHTGRHVRFLAERNLFRARPLAGFLTAVGAIPGEPDAAVELLSRGELCGVYPGGIDDSWKLTATQRYRLQWGERAGFARIAIRAQVPIVPVVGLGIDEIYDVIAREPWLGRRLFGHARYDLPLALGRWGTLLPRPVTLRFFVLPPVNTRGLDAERADDVRAVREQTFEAIDAVLRGVR